MAANLHAQGFTVIGQIYITDLHAKFTGKAHFACKFLDVSLDVFLQIYIQTNI